MIGNQSFSGHEPPPVVSPTATDQNSWLRPVLIFLFLGYWMIAWYLERIDLANVPLAGYLQFLIPFALPSWMTFIRELFRLRVLRHFIPVVVGWWLAYEAAASLVKALYDLPDRPGAKELLSRLIQAQSPSGKPFAVSEERVAAERDKLVLLRVGGPGVVQVNRGNVVVTELNGYHYRILSTGIYNLHRFEYVHAVLDLHPQERSAFQIPLMTQDGIQFMADVHVRYQIETGNVPVTRERPFPFNETAVLAAAYAQTVAADGEVANWQTMPINKARGILTTIVAGYRLDEILANSSAADPLQVIQSELMRKTRAALRTVGIKLSDIHVGRLEFPEDVTEQYIKYWKSHSDARIRLSLADGEATALEEIEIARAEAEVTMIQAILEGVQRARHSTNMTGMREVVALRMVEALEKMARQSQQVQTLPPQLLTQLTTIRQQLHPGRRPDDTQGRDAS